MYILGLEFAMYLLKDHSTWALVLNEGHFGT